MAAAENEFEVVGFHPSYAGAFAALNYAWIERYFQIEEEDRLALEDPQRYAIDPGGEIFFLLHHSDEQTDGEVDKRTDVVGTVAMVPKSAQVLELAKMAVAEGYQGRGLANRLMQACIDYARAKQCAQITLTTNSNLAPAVGLYRRFGFEALAENGDTRYARGDLQMTLALR